jgi:vacuolar protein sorting-associated protein 18
MSIEPYGGFIPSSTAAPPDDSSELPIFNVERVQLQFPRPSDFVAAQVANNAIILAFSTGRLLRIDLEDAGEIEGMLGVKVISEGER